MCMGVFSVYCVCVWCLQRPEKDIRSPKIGITEGG